MRNRLILNWDGKKMIKIMIKLMHLNWILITDKDICNGSRWEGEEKDTK